MMRKLVFLLIATLRTTSMASNFLLVHVQNPNDEVIAGPLSEARDIAMRQGKQESSKFRLLSTYWFIYICVCVCVCIE